MANDVRISSSLPTHPKTKKLNRRLGAEGVLSLIYLFIWVATNKPDGQLVGMTDEDIELAADWGGEEGTFAATLADVRFLDGEEGSRAIHDWAEHNPWAAGSEMRSAKARWNSAKRHHGEAEADRLVPEYAATRTPSSKQSQPLKDASSNASSKHVAEDTFAGSNAPSPSPSPSPNDINEPNGSVGGADRLPRCDYQAIVDHYHQKLPEMPPIRLMSDGRKKALSSFWKFVLTSKKSDGSKRAETAEGALEWIGDYFERARHNDFLMGRGPRGSGHENWKCDLDFLLTEKGRRHVIEKTEVPA